MVSEKNLKRAKMTDVGTKWITITDMDYLGLFGLKCFPQYCFYIKFFEISESPILLLIAQLGCKTLF